MQTQTFRIDQTQLNKIRNRTVLNSAQIMVPVFLVTTLSQYWQHGLRSFGLAVLSYLITTPLLVLPIYFSANKLKKRYRTLEIVLSDKGVETKGEGFPTRLIPWNRLLIEEKQSGFIMLADGAISKLARYAYGRGRISIVPEVANRTELLSTLRSKAH